MCPQVPQLQNDLAKCLPTEEIVRRKENNRFVGKAAPSTLQVWASNPGVPRPKATLHFDFILSSAFRLT